MIFRHHQQIWFPTDEPDEYELRIPKVINSDVGFQLMFGMPPDYNYDEFKQNQNHKEYNATIYEIPKGCDIY